MSTSPCWLGRARCAGWTDYPTSKAMSAPRPLKNVGRRFCAPGCRRLLVYRGGAFLGVVRLTDVADAMAGPPGRRDLVLNLVGGFTFLLAVGVIAMLLYELPAMLHVAGQLGR